MAAADLTPPANESGVSGRVEAELSGSRAAASEDEAPPSLLR